MKLRDLSIDEIESLAVGAWVLGTGGGGNPYLPLLNMRALYRDGHRNAYPYNQITREAVPERLVFKFLSNT